MKRRWFMFEHATHSPKREDGSRAPGLLGAHLGVAGPATVQPACNVTAQLVPRSAEPTGFVTACCACLALSELP